MVQIKDMLLTPNPYSRPQKPVNVKAIVWHWVANPNSTAEGNRNFFENRKLGKSGYGSAHYVINLDGTVIRCLPDNEMAYAVGSPTYTPNALKELGSYPNSTTISIECTHTDWDGKMTDATRSTLIQLTADLCKKFGLTADDIWTHKEVVGWKDCHKWYDHNPADYEKDKNAVAQLLNHKPVVTPQPVDVKNVVYVDADASGMYEIKKNDTLWGISQALDISVDAIMKLNPSINPNALTVGQKIRVKAVTMGEYVIKKGDTLWGIAHQYNTTVDKLDELNKGLQATALQVGAKIIVPNGDGSVAPVAPKPTPAPTPKPVPVPVPKPVPVTPKPVPTPPAHVHAFTKLGRVKGDVWSHTQSNFDESSRKDIVKTNTSVKICCEQNGAYYTSEDWISAKYIDIVGDLNKVDLPNVVLKQGAKGANVVQVQRALNKLNFKCGAEDGIFGASTADALKRFQMVYDAYHVDGVYGASCEAKMEALLNK